MTTPAKAITAIKVQFFPPEVVAEESSAEESVEFVELVELD